MKDINVARHFFVAMLVSMGAAFIIGFLPHREYIAKQLVSEYRFMFLPYILGIFWMIFSVGVAVGQGKILAKKEKEG